MITSALVKLNVSDLVKEVDSRWQPVYSRTTSGLPRGIGRLLPSVKIQRGGKW